MRRLCQVLLDRNVGDREYEPASARRQRMTGASKQAPTEQAVRDADVAKPRSVTGPPFPEPEDERGAGAGTGRPRWVSIVAIILGIALLALIVILHLTGVIEPGGH